MAAVEVSGGDAVEVMVMQEEEEQEELAKCECCGLLEECTPRYVAVVREQHGGRWICGLCADAMEDEVRRAGMLISLEEALERHATFCQNFLSPPPAVAPVERLVAAVRQVLRRRLEPPRAVRSMPSSPQIGWGCDGQKPVRPGSNCERLSCSDRLRK